MSVDDPENANMDALQEIGEIAHAIIVPQSTPHIYRRMTLMQSIRSLGKKDKNLTPHSTNDAHNTPSTIMVGPAGHNGNGRVIYQPAAFGNMMAQFEEYRDFLAAQKKRRGGMSNAHAGNGGNSGHSGDRLLAQMRRRMFLLHHSEQELSNLLRHSSAMMKEETEKTASQPGNDSVPLIAKLSGLLGDGLAQLSHGHHIIHGKLANYERTILELRKETRKNPERLMSRYQHAKNSYGSLPQSAKDQEVAKATMNVNSSYGDLFNELEYNLKRRDTTCLRSLKGVASAYVDMFRTAQESFSQLEQFLDTLSEEENNNMRQEPQRSERAHVVAYHSDSTLPNRIFGAPLTNVLVTNKSEEDVTKAFSLQFNIRQLFDTVRMLGTNVEGIFRVPGNEKFMRDVIQMLEMGHPIIVLSQKDHYIHSIAGVLKAWIRDLPEPLMTYNAFEELLPLADHLIDPEQRKHIDFSPINQANAAAPSMDVGADRWGNVVIASHVRHFIQTRMTRDHQFVLAKVMSLLHDIARNEPSTRMNAKNLGIVFGMNLFRPRNENPLLIAANVQKMSALVELMCGDRYDQIFQNLQIVEDIDTQLSEWQLSETQYQDVAILVDPECVGETILPEAEELDDDDEEEEDFEYEQELIYYDDKDDDDDYIFDGKYVNTIPE